MINYFLEEKDIPNFKDWREEFNKIIKKIIPEKELEGLYSSQSLLKRHFGGEMGHDSDFSKRIAIYEKFLKMIKEISENHYIALLAHHTVMAKSSNPDIKNLGEKLCNIDELSVSAH